MRNFRRICYVLVFLIYLYCPVSAQIWLSNKDIYNEAEEYLDAEEENDGDQFELLLDDGLLLEEGEEAASPTTAGSTDAGQRGTQTKTVGEVKDGFITILE